MLATPSCVLLTCDRLTNRSVAILLDTVRVVTHLGAGTARYVTDDGFLGVQLDGEQRVDEYAGTVR